MDWEFHTEFNKNTLKAAKGWFNPVYYLYPLIPLLVGTFYAASYSDFRLFTLILLAVTLVLGRTCVSALASLKQQQGEEIVYCPCIFEGIKLPLNSSVLTFLAALCGILALVFGLILCLICGFGLLTFGVLSLAVSTIFILGYSGARSWLSPALAFFSQGFLITAAAYYCQTGYFSSDALAISLPLGFIAAALVLRTGLSSDNDFVGQRENNLVFALIFLAYAFIIINILYGVSSFWVLLLFLLIPFLKKDMVTATGFKGFYLKFGFCYSLCLLLALTF